MDYVNEEQMFEKLLTNHFDYYKIEI